MSGFKQPAEYSVFSVLSNHSWPRRISPSWNCWSLDRAAENPPAGGSAIVDSGRDLVIRVGSNVRLLKKLGSVRERAGTVYLWPDAVARRNLPPVVLRLVVAHDGRHPVYLVTSILDPRELTDEQILELYNAAGASNCFIAASNRLSVAASSAVSRRRRPKWKCNGRSSACGRCRYTR